MKKELTIKQKKNRFRAAQIASLAGEYVAPVVPMVTMMLINREKWFPNQQAGTRVGIGGGLSILFGLVGTFIITRLDNSNKKVQRYVTALLVYVIFLIILICLRDLLNQIIEIMLFELIGIASGCGLDITRQVFQGKADDALDTIKQATKGLDKEQAAKEIVEEKKKIKVRIK